MTEYDEGCCLNEPRDYCRLQTTPCACACHGEDEIQVTIHGKYSRGPMPVEFRDALVEMVRLVKQAIDDGTLSKRRARPAPGAVPRDGGKDASSM